MSGEADGRDADAAASARTSLLPLTPNYDEPSHRVYVDAIEDALKHSDEIKNIALTGGYGVGKSSILAEIVRDHKDAVAQVSLSTLGLPDGDGGGEISPTNRIQKEIVKQLLYREVPVRMAGSRFRRIGQFPSWRGLGLASLGGFVIALVFFLTGWTATLAGLFKPIFDIDGWFNLVTFVVFSLGLYAVLALAHNRIVIKGFTIAKTDITLASDQTTFFDQYLDEIVYFFDVTERTIVVFEDIDRFDDPHIFETLRALNTLLNGARQLKGRSIRFIYAIKDSIFEELGDRAAGSTGETSEDTAAAQVARANRTKFFDLVIPVVPFITRNNGRELIGRVMSGASNKISEELVTLAARYLPDMRLIKNVRNEFVIFRQKVMRADDGGELELTDDALLAMMLYKSTHLSDFEAIRTGDSKLDTLYDASTSLVTHNLRKLNTEATALRQELRSLDSAESRSATLGPALVSFVERMGQRLGVSARTTATISLAGTAYSDEDLNSAAFWRAFAAAENQLTVNFQGRAQFAITKEDATEILGDSLSNADWDESEREARQSRLAEIQAARDFLSHASLKDLVEHEEYVDSDEEPFRTHVAKLSSALARQLVTGGYLDRYYALYTTPFYAGSVSTRAQNFLMHNVDRNAMDVNFVLEPDDVDAILKQRGPGILSERSMFNIAVANHLIKLGGQNRDRFVRALINATVDDRTAFLDAYLADGVEVDTLIAMLANGWSDVYVFLASPDRTLVDEQRLHVMDAALRGIADRRTYAVDDEFRQLLQSGYGGLPVIISDSTNADLARCLTQLLVTGELRLEDISPLGTAMQSAVVAADAYVLNKMNLVTVTGDEKTLSLDQLRGANKTVYNYILRNLSGYLAIRNEIPGLPTVASADALAPVVADVVQVDEDRLRDILEGAVDGAVVPQLTAVPSEAWPELASHRQFPLTFANVTAYIEAVGSVDGPLGAQLADQKVIDVPDDTDQVGRKQLAKLILAAQSTIPAPEARAELVEGLELDDWLAVGDVPPEKGALIGLLIEHKVIRDTAESFALAVAQDWPTREIVINKSKEFVNFMTPTEIPLADVPSLMRSAKVPDVVKIAVVTRADEFVSADQNAALSALAAYAVAKSIAVPLQLVTRMASMRVSAALVVQLLQPLLPQITLGQLVPILASLGGDYALASARGTKHPKLSNTPEDEALLKRLKQLDVVSTFDLKWGKLVANLKKP